LGAGEGKNPAKKIHAKVNAKKKNSCKEEDKGKKFMQKEGIIATFIYNIKLKNWLVSIKIILIETILGALPQEHYC